MAVRGKRLGTAALNNRKKTNSKFYQIFMINSVT